VMNVWLVFYSGSGSVLRRWHKIPVVSDVLEHVQTHALSCLELNDDGMIYSPYLLPKHHLLFSLVQVLKNLQQQHSPNYIFFVAGTLSIFVCCW